MFADVFDVSWLKNDATGTANELSDATSYLYSVAPETEFQFKVNEETVTGAAVETGATGLVTAILMLELALAISVMPETREALTRK